MALFLLAIVPVITDQVAQITDNAPGWLDQLQKNDKVQDLDDRFDIIDKVREYVQDGNFTSGIFGGVLGFGLELLGALANTFVIIVLTLYFLSSLERTKRALYRLAPASRRERVSKLGDRVVASVGGYVAGAFVVAVCAGRQLAGLPVRRRPRRVRRRAGVRRDAARRHPDDRRHDRRGDRVAIGFATDVRIGLVLRDLLPGLPAGGELRPLPAGDVEAPSTSPARPP